MGRELLREHAEKLKMEEEHDGGREGWTKGK